MKGFISHLAYDFKSGIRDKTLMLMNYIFPLGFFFIVGLFMTRINPLFTEIIIPGMVLFALMSSALLTIPGTMVDQREAGVYRGFRVNGVPAASLIVIPILGCLFHTTLACGIITIGSIHIYGGLAPLNWGWFVIVFLITALALNSLGILIGIVSQNPRASVLIAQAFYIPSMLLGGLMVPESMMPENLKAIASLFPATHGVRAFSSLAFSAEGFSLTAFLPLLILLLSLIINLALSFALFQWDRKPERKGRLFLSAAALIPFCAGVVLSL